MRSPLSNRDPANRPPSPCTSPCNTSLTAGERQLPTFSTASVLAALEKRDCADPAIIEILRRNGLITTRPGQEFCSALQHEAELRKQNEDLSCSIMNTKDRLRKINNRRATLVRQLLDPFVLGSERDQAERRECRELQENIARLEAQKSAESNLRRAEDLSGFSYWPQADLGVKITPKGDLEMKRLAARRSSLEGGDYLKVSTATQAFMDRVTDITNRAVGAWSTLSSLGYLASDRAAIHLALAIAARTDAPSEVLHRANNETPNFHERVWATLDPLATAAEILLGGDQYPARKDRIAAALEFTREKGFLRTAEDLPLIWRMAVNWADIPGAADGDKYRRVCDLTDALARVDHNTARASVMEVAVLLAKEKGTVSEIVDSFRSVERELIQHGFKPGTNLNQAALCLLRAPGNAVEKAAKADVTCRFLRDYGLSVASGESNYTAAACISLMPGCVEANVQSLSELVRYGTSLPMLQGHTVALDYFVAIYTLGVKEFLAEAGSNEQLAAVLGNQELLWHYQDTAQIALAPKVEPRVTSHRTSQQDDGGWVAPPPDFIWAPPPPVIF